MSVATTVGSGEPRLESDGTLRVSGTYASTDLGQQTRALVNEGHIRTTSVTFLRKTGAKGSGGKTSRELLNGTFCAVPVNPEALVLRSKGSPLAVGEKGPELKAGARNSNKDQSALQTAHDALVEAGAMCSTGKAVADPINPPSEDAEDANPADIAQALDASIDEALALLEATDTSTLPEEVAQAIALFQGADILSDELLDALGVPDPDEDATEAVTAAAPKSAAAAQAAAAADLDSAAAELAVRERAIRLIAG